MLRLTPQGVDNTNTFTFQETVWNKRKEAAFAVKFNSVPVQTPVVVLAGSLEWSIWLSLCPSAPFKTFSNKGQQLPVKWFWGSWEKIRWKIWDIKGHEETLIYNFTPLLISNYIRPESSKGKRCCQPFPEQNVKCSKEGKWSFSELIPKPWSRSNCHLTLRTNSQCALWPGENRGGSYLSLKFRKLP